MQHIWCTAAAAASHVAVIAAVSNGLKRVDAGSPPRLAALEPCPRRRVLSAHPSREVVPTKVARTADDGVCATIGSDGENVAVAEVQSSVARSEGSHRRVLSAKSSLEVPPPKKAARFVCV